MIFTDKARRLQIRDLLGTEDEWMLNRLQAGRTGPVGLFGIGSQPYRLSKEELIKLKDEYIFIDEESDCVYARFEKPVNEIRAILGLEPQDNPFNQF